MKKDKTSAITTATTFLQPETPKMLSFLAPAESHASVGLKKKCRQEEEGQQPANKARPETQPTAQRSRSYTHHEIMRIPNDEDMMVIHVAPTKLVHAFRRI